MTEEIIKECEFYLPLSENCNEILDSNGNEVYKCSKRQDCYYKQLKRLEQELKWANDEEKYLKDCCIKAGKELEKHSFKWDGKEKNLVVQALQLNQLYEKLEQERDEYKECFISTDTNAKKIQTKLFEKEELCKELEQENKELKEKVKSRENELANMAEQANMRINAYRSALEEIRNYCDRIKQGSVVGTQDCLINSIKNIVNYSINEVLNEGK